MSMATKCYLLYKKTGKHVDNELRTKEELLAKLKEIMQNAGLDEDAINSTYDYQEVDDGGTSTEQNASAATEANDDEFVSKDNNDGEYFPSTNDYYSPALSDDAKGWNKLLDSLNVDSEYKPYLELREGDQGDNSGEWDVRKNAIRVLYLNSEFNKFYHALDRLPSSLSSYLKSHSHFVIVKSEYALDVIKEDMEDIVGDLLKCLRAYNEGNDKEDDRQEIFDEVKEFDEEIQNLHQMIMMVGHDNVGKYQQMANDWAAIDSQFKEYCKGQPTPSKLSQYLMDIATKKYHLGRIKMDSNDDNSTLDGSWMNPEDKATHNVRLSDNIGDYLDLKNKKMLGDADQKAVDEIIEKFKKKDITQEEANKEIHSMVSKAREQLRTSLDIFFKLMGVNDANVRNQFTSGLYRLDENEYQQNWRYLVNNYKDILKKRIDVFKKAHSNDMTAEAFDGCMNELNALLANADSMLEAVNKGDGEQLIGYAQEICKRIESVKKTTAEARKGFKK